MMAAWHKITVLQNLVSRLNGLPKCEVCGQRLEIGKAAWAHLCPRQRMSYTEYYCVACYRKMWI